jgi:hypothetical protein
MAPPRDAIGTAASQSVSAEFRYSLGTIRPPPTIARPRVS